jgi:hypothetical protein
LFVTQPTTVCIDADKEALGHDDTKKKEESHWTNDFADD